MNIDDFFNSNKKKLFNSNNKNCKKCNETIEDYKEYLEKLENIKNITGDIEKPIFENNFIPLDSSLWTYDYQGNNSIRNKIFNKLKTKTLNIDYSNFKTKEKLNRDLNDFRSIKENLIKEYGLWDIF